MSRHSVRELKDEGFTLMELLIVIVVLAVLAGIVVFAVGTTSANADAASCQTDAKTLESALQEYKAQVSSFPAAGLGAQLLVAQVVGGQTVGPFLRQLPGTNHYIIATDGNGNVYVYPADPPGPIAPANIAADALNMPHRTVNQLLGGADTTSLSFEGTNGAICNDTNVLS